MKERRDICIGVAILFALAAAPSAPVMTLVILLPFGAGYARAAVHYHRAAEARGEL